MVLVLSKEGVENGMGNEEKNIKTRTLREEPHEVFSLKKGFQQRDFYLKEKKDDNIKQKTFLGKY